MERSEIERALDEFVVGDAWPVIEDAETLIPIPDEMVAARILRGLRRLRTDREKIYATANDELARIAAFVADSVSGLDREIARGERSLENYMRTLNEARPSVRSAKVANGRLGLTRTTYSVEVVDEAAFWEWCGVVLPDPEAPPTNPPTLPDLSGATHPEFVRVTIAPAKSVLAKLDHATLDEEAEETEDGHVVHQLLLRSGEDDVELVPGVVVRREKSDRFNLTLGTE